jgi:BioD-like phosphotransacetylase family protein
VAVLQIVGNQSGAGKTSLAAALLVIANAAGKKAAYYKPFADGRTADSDVAFMSELSTSLDGPAVPAPGNKSDSSDLSPAQAEISRLESEAGVVIVEGPDGQAPYGFNGKVVLVYQGSAESVSESITTAGANLAAVFVNSVPIHRRDEVARGLAGQSVPVAVIPENRGMLAVTVEQLAEHLGGQWVLDPVNTGSPVERIMIGGNILDEGPTYFDRYANQAVITRVERPDIQMASMCDKTACLVLTGPGEPTEYIKAEALKRDVPLIQVRTNTHDTAEALAGLLDKADARTTAKAHHFAELLARHTTPEGLEQLLS